MGRPLVFIIGAGLIIGLALPSPKLTPHRVTSPSEPPRPTELEMTSGGSFYAYAKVNGQFVKFVVDTGATDVALTEEDAERVGVKVERGSFRIIGESASGFIRGQVIKIDSIELDGKLVNDVNGIVIENASHSLLGQSYLSRLNEVQLRGDRMVLR